LCQAGLAHPYLIQNIDLSINIQHPKVGGGIEMVVKYDHNLLLLIPLLIFTSVKDFRSPSLSNTPFPIK